MLARSRTRARTAAEKKARGQPCVTREFGDKLPAAPRVASAKVVLVIFVAGIRHFAKPRCDSVATFTHSLARHPHAAFELSECEWFARFARASCLPPLGNVASLVGEIRLVWLSSAGKRAGARAFDRASRWRRCSFWPAPNSRGSTRAASHSWRGDLMARARTRRHSRRQI